MRSGAALALGLAALAASCAEEPRPPCTGSAAFVELATVCGFAKPEDVETVAARRLVLVSEMGWDAPARGGALSALALDANGRPLDTVLRLWPRGSAEAAPDALRGDPACRQPPDPNAFSGHGLGTRTVAGAVEIAVVGHGAREAIELFELEGAGEAARAVWGGCVPLPPDTAGNDVAFHSDGRLFVTNYLPSVHGIGALLSLIRGSLGGRTGDVLVWSPDGGWSHLAGTEAAIPNGLALAPDGSTLWVAELGAKRLLRFSLTGTGVAERREIPLRRSPDNLSWSTEGTLLAATLEVREDAWSLEIVDPGSLATRVVFESSGAELRSVTSVTDTGRTLVVGSGHDDRVGLLRRQPP